MSTAPDLAALDAPILAEWARDAALAAVLATSRALSALTAGDDVAARAHLRTAARYARRIEQVAAGRRLPYVSDDALVPITAVELRRRAGR